MDGSSLSPAIASEETSEALGPQMALLMIVALLVIAALLFVFTRSLFDLILSLLGLVVTIFWIFGAQGWLGPNGVGLIGAPNALTTMVPIMLIGLVLGLRHPDCCAVPGSSATKDSRCVRPSALG